VEITLADGQRVPVLPGRRYRFAVTGTIRPAWAGKHICGGAELAVVQDGGEHYLHPQHIETVAPLPQEHWPAHPGDLFFDGNGRLRFIQQDPAGRLLAVAEYGSMPSRLLDLALASGWRLARCGLDG
jgi:hypothetical protein